MGKHEPVAFQTAPSWVLVFPFSSAVRDKSLAQLRVRLEVLYSRDVDVDGDEFEGLRKAYLRTKRIVQETYPDVLVVGVQKATRRGDDATFEVAVDNKLVYAKPRDREGIYLSQRTLHREIMRARKARRPSTTYYRLEAVDDDDDEYPRVVVPDK